MTSPRWAKSASIGPMKLIPRNGVDRRSAHLNRLRQLMRHDGWLEVAVHRRISRQASLSQILIRQEPADRSDSGLWPSDHAGVVVELKIGD
jgi:hypothetical protein